MGQGKVSLTKGLREARWYLFITHKHKKITYFLWGCPGVPVHGGIPIVFISIHGVVTQFVNVFKGLKG